MKFERGGGEVKLRMGNLRAPHPLYETLYVYSKHTVIQKCWCCYVSTSLRLALRCHSLFQLTSFLYGAMAHTHPQTLAKQTDKTTVNTIAADTYVHNYTHNTSFVVVS